MPLVREVSAGLLRLADGSVDPVWPADKGEWVRDLATYLQVPAERVATVGDYRRDLEMFQAGTKAFWVGGNVDVPAFITTVADGDLLAAAQAIVNDWAV